jgi:MFS family permease
VALAESLFGDRAGILRTRQFQLLLLANVNGALGLVVISPFLEVLTGPFGVSDARVGLLMTAYTVPPFVLIPVVGMLADRYGRKPILIAGLVVFGLSGAAISLTTDFQVALGLRVIQGVGYAGLVPVIVTSIGDLYAGPTEATAQGLRFTSSGLTHTVFPVMAGLLVAVAWQFPFLLYLVALPIALAVLLYFDETLGADTEGEETLTDGGHRGRGAYAREIAGLAIQPKLAAVYLAIAVPSVLHIAFLTYNSFIVVRALGSTPGVAGILLALVSIVYATAASQAGRVTDFFGSRVVPIVVAMVCMGAGLSVVAMAPILPVAAVGTVSMGLGVGLCFSLLRSVLTTLAPETHRGGLVGLGESIIRLANSIGPVVIGWLIVVFTPAVGDVAALRYSLVGVAVVGAAIGVGAMVAARAAGPVSA